MEDRIIMGTILTNVKSVCDLMMHGTIESSTPDVHGVFSSALGGCLEMQNKIYNKMQQKGWYETQNVEKTKIDSALQKYAQKQPV